MSKHTKSKIFCKILGCQFLLNSLGGRRPFSHAGQFVLRAGSDLHQALAVRALSEGESLNRYVVRCLRVLFESHGSFGHLSIFVWQLFDLYTSVKSSNGNDVYAINLFIFFSSIEQISDCIFLTVFHKIFNIFKVFLAYGRGSFYLNRINCSI